jgi:hypothetical protein
MSASWGEAKGIHGQTQLKSVENDPERHVFPPSRAIELDQLPRPALVRLFLRRRKSQTHEKE